MSLTGLNGQTMTYDSNGNIKTVTQKTGTGSSDKITTTYTYDSTFKHRLLSTSNGTTTQSITYDAVGNVASTTLSGSSGKKIGSSASFTGGGNRTASVTDSTGNTTSYTYSTSFYEMLGQPTYIINPKGTYDVYEMDTLGRTDFITFANSASLDYTYSSGMLSSIRRILASNTSNTQTYNFTYDSFGNTTGIKIGSTQNLATYTYGARNGLLQTQTYGNGSSVSFTYDTLGRVKTAAYSGGRTLTYRYTGDGQLYSVTDSNGLTYQYSYDTLGRLMSSSVRNSSGTVLTTRQTYDANNQLTAQYWQLGSTNYSESYTYSKTTGLLATHKPAVGNTLTYGYDALQRLSSVTGGIYGKTYTYRDISTTNTTAQVSQLKYDLPTDITYGYTYDVLGNIATYTENGTTYTYTYDAQNQLTKQTGGGKTYTYSYDAVGNILSASDGTASHTYTYGNTTWRDLLTKYDGHAISYDASGNPTTYYNGKDWTMAWAEGRRLVSANGDGKSLSFTYDSEGLRLTKTVGSTVYNYSYAGGKLLRQTGGGNTLDFFYDANGNPYALKYNGTLYYYITNLQGDVLKIVNTSGTPVVSYTYDPYGKPQTPTGTLASTLGAHNPLRYRGYTYDTETGLYYLQSRYYDPTIGRFINADAFAATGQGVIGYNVFAYCVNSPVGSKDSSGYAVEIGFDIASAILSLLALIKDPTWANGSFFAWDIASVLVAFLPGSYVVKGGKIAIKVADSIADFVEGSKFLTGTYKQLKKLFKGIKGIEIHHLVEKRFAGLFKSSIDDFLSIPLTTELHQSITNAWRNLHKTSDLFENFAYGSNYLTITYDQMVEAVKQVYSDMPDVLKAVLEWIKENWKGN